MTLDREADVQFYSHHVPTRVVAGPGCLDELAKLVSGWPRQCLVVCGQRFARLSGLLEQVQEQLEAGKITGHIFDGVEPNPSTRTVLEGAERARQQQARWILALGGGSTIDAAKAIALKTVNQGKLADFAGNMRPENPPLPLVAIPTTAGTGSEVTPYAVLTDTREVDKFGIAMPELFPRLALLDARLTVSMPEAVTIDSGLDALSHAVEALFSRKRSLFSDLVAERAAWMVLHHLPRARQAPEDLDARAGMLEAACLAGMAIADTGTLIPHALSYPVTIRFGIPHGRATALLLPALLERLVAVQPDRCQRVGTLLGDTEQPARALRAFIESLGVAPRLGAYGMQNDCLELLAGQAYGKKHVGNTPGEWSRQDLEQLYRASC